MSGFTVSCRFQSICNRESCRDPRQKRWMLKKQLMVKWWFWQSDFIKHTASALKWQTPVVGWDLTQQTDFGISEGLRSDLHMYPGWLAVYVAAECRMCSAVDRKSCCFHLISSRCKTIHKSHNGIAIYVNTLLICNTASKMWPPLLSIIKSPLLTAVDSCKKVSKKRI